MQHTLKAFDADIDGMRSTVMAMGGLVEKQLSRAIEAVESADLRLVSQVLVDEDVVNKYHIQADIICNRILAKRQPLAIDLREVIGAIHTVNDLERIGDESKKIALRARELEHQGARAKMPIAKISQMAEAVRAMLQQALDAFLRHDTEVASRLVAQDADVDKLRDELKAAMVELISSQSTVVTAALDLIFIVQSLERIGDHAKNISEYVVSVVKGLDVRYAGGDFSKATQEI